MSFLVNAVKIIFLLGFLVFIHEGGHFLAAKLFKVKVEEFSIGFGPKIFSKKRKETVYSVGCIPFGGYVKMIGETERSEEEGAFNKAKLCHRIVIVAAGATVNIVFAIIVFFGLSFFSSNGVSTTVESILPEATENIAGIEVGDKILQINNTKIRLKSDISKALRDYTDGDILVTVERNKEKIDLKVKPTEYEEGLYILGIEARANENLKLTERFYYSFWETANFLDSIVESLKMLFTGKVGIEQMTGPIGISEIVVRNKRSIQFYIFTLLNIAIVRSNKSSSNTSFRWRKITITNN